MGMPFPGSIILLQENEGWVYHPSFFKYKTGIYANNILYKIHIENTGRF